MTKIAMICTSLAVMSAVACAQQVGQTHEGVHAAKIVNLTGSWSYGMDTGLDRDTGGSTDHASVTAGTTYTLSFWMRNDRPEPSLIARVAIACFSATAFIADFNYLQDTSVPGGTTWTKQTIEWVAPPNAAHVNVSFRMQYGGNHQLVVDEVSFLDNAAPTVELLTNPGFESWTQASPDHWRGFGVGGAVYELVKIIAPPPAAANVDWQLLD